MLKGKIPILIPAYNPGEELYAFLNQESLEVFEIVLIDDGSRLECRDLFDRVAALPHVRVLRHAVNRGKGAALKTGMDALLQQDKSLVGVVTADADGQHEPAQIRALVEAAQNNPQAFILGVRDFDAPQVPWRSRFGNRATRFLFRVFRGVRLSDTQTGLRYVPKHLIPSLLKVPFDRYEFEMEMLLIVTRSKLRIVEVPISTVYIDNNKSSHFNPLKDSFRIYFVFFRFALSSVASAALDLVLFSILISFGTSIVAATFLSRIVSGLFNFSVARKIVFSSQASLSRQVTSYLVLAIFLASMSSFGVKSVVALGWLSAVPAKIIIESALFIFSFSVQRSLIFIRDLPDGNS